MWTLTSMGRPKRIREMVDSYAWGAESPVLLTLWEGDPTLRQYLDQAWPANWRTEIVPMRGNGPTYNEILMRYPDEPCYGFLADDVLLDVPGMLGALEKGAGAWNVAYANDQHHRDLIPTMPCLGGDLVRAVGYLSVPNLVHWGVDTAWGEIGRRLGALRYFEQLTYTHNNVIFGTAPDDRTYQQARINSFGWESLIRAWLINDLPRTIARVQAQMLEKAA